MDFELEGQGRIQREGRVIIGRVFPKKVMTRKSPLKKHSRHVPVEGNEEVAGA